jgi:hypothetical protein
MRSADGPGTGADHRGALPLRSPDLPPMQVRPTSRAAPPLYLQRTPQKRNHEHENHLPLLGLALLTGCASTPPATAAGTPTPAKTTANTVRPVYGNVDVAISEAQSNAYVHADLTDPNWSSCTSDLVGYSDVNAGTQVTVTDAEGAIIGIGELEAGAYGAVANAGTTCTFRFVVESVPLDGDFFSVQIGNEIRGKTQFTLREMQVGPRLFLG